MFKAALTFSLTTRGIPFLYYGSEQGYSGGRDPQNRETLWTNMDPSYDLYVYVALINTARKAQ